MHIFHAHSCFSLLFVSKKNLFMLTRLDSAKSFAKIFWKVQVASKVKVCAWTAIFQCLDTNDMLQVCRPNCTLSLDIYMMCHQEGGGMLSFVLTL